MTARGYTAWTRSADWSPRRYIVGYVVRQRGRPAACPLYLEQITLGVGRYGAKVRRTIFSTRSEARAAARISGAIVTLIRRGKTRRSRLLDAHVRPPESPPTP